MEFNIIYSKIVTKLLKFKIKILNLNQHKIRMINMRFINLKYKVNYY